MDGYVFAGHLARIVGEDVVLDYMRNFGDPNGEHGIDGLKNYEALAFYAYTTTTGWHEIINRELWSGSPSASVSVFETVLNAALAKLPIYRGNDGLVYRGYQERDLPALLSSYREGAVVPFAGFTSAAFRLERAFGGNVLFTIRAQTARAVWHLSPHYEECEVLIPSARTFRILNVAATGGRVVINMEEQP